MLFRSSQAPALISTSRSSPVTLANGSFDVLVYGNPETEILVEATGKVGDITEKAILSVYKMSLFDFALAGNVIDISGNAARIYGNIVYRDGPVPLPLGASIIPLGWTATKDATLSYPPHDIPSDAGLALIDPSGSLVFSGIQTKNINVNSRGTLLEMKNNNHTLNIVLGSTTPQDLILKVDTFKLNGGNIVLHGKGRLLLYVNTFEGGGNFKTDRKSVV